MFIMDFLGEYQNLHHKDPYDRSTTMIMRIMLIITDNCTMTVHTVLGVGSRDDKIREREREIGR